MGINDALSFLSQNAVTVTGKGKGVLQGGGRTLSMSQQEFDRANKVALDAVATFAVSAVKSMLSRPHPPSSAPGDSPARRTGTLRDSIHWRAGRSSRQFPGPVPRDMSPASIKRFKADDPDKYGWYKEIKNRAYKDKSIIQPYPKADVAKDIVRVIEVDPSAPDRSDRQRLEYYSYYLETGWHSDKNRQFRDKGTKGASPVKVGRSRPQRDTDVGGWNPPRPYLMKLARPNYKSAMEVLYQQVLMRELPANLRSLAFRARLSVTYNHSLRVPYVSNNKALLD